MSNVRIAIKDSDYQVIERVEDRELAVAAEKAGKRVTELLIHGEWTTLVVDVIDGQPEDLGAEVERELEAVS